MILAERVRATVAALMHATGEPQARLAEAPRGADAVAHSRSFWMLAGPLTFSALAVSVGVVALVPLLVERGCSTTEAAWATGLGGVGKTLGCTLCARHR
ncbi:MFS transporter [Streptomyces sp. IB201691-2A2]|uniref:MFS transporter n=1 Tax=Streptomyces sp. IB201691-2A2 TaxID=2561920 RepID=UPI001180760B|nr:MFS transporter [Streptomyces sp. IB201691-2A2]TRO55837.1 hypothetical protein E4K73_49080 [Streptomyces sp. IB201691-2A2]